MSIETTTLSNGLRIVTDTISHVETVSLGIWVKAGTRNETLHTNGVAHFLEHMAFKGTKKRSAQEIAESIENVGGYLNAYTSREITAYYARVLKGDTPLAVDILMDILQHSTFAEEEMEKEREVIIQEIGQSNDTPDDIIFDYFQETAFPDQSMGWPILGPIKNIKNMSRETLIDFMKQHYDPTRMVIAAAGNIKHDVFIKLVRDNLHVTFNTTPNVSPKGAYKGGSLIQKRPLEQLHVLYGFEGIPFHHADFYTASLYATVLGGGMASRLFQEVREKRGLVYTIYAFASAYQDTGLFGIYAGTSEKESAQLMDVIQDELKKSTHTLTVGELNRAKQQIKASILMSMESTSSRSKRLAQQLLTYDRIISTEEIVKKIDAMTLDQVHQFAGQLVTAPTTFTALGPTAQLPTVG